VSLGVTISSTGYNDWSKELTTDRIDPGQSVTWKLGVSEIRSRGNDASGNATLNCDQNK
jgi:hypothetical protein